MKSVLAPGLSDMKKAPVHTRKHHRRVILNGIDKFPVFAIEWQLRGPPHAHAQLYSVRQADTRGHGEGYGCRAASSPSSTLTPSTLPRPSLTKSSTGVHQPAFLAPSKPCVHAASSSPNAAESVQEGADAGRAAATAMIALAPTAWLPSQRHIEHRPWQRQHPTSRLCISDLACVACSATG